MSRTPFSNVNKVPLTPTVQSTILLTAFLTEVKQLLWSLGQILLAGFNNYACIINAFLYNPVFNVLNKMDINLLILFQRSDNTFTINVHLFINDIVHFM